MYKLQIRDDEGKTTVVPLTRDELTIGRKEGNTIRLTERNVSRTHARFLTNGDKVFLEDMSRYGTRVNGQRVTDVKPLSSGDIVQIGDYEIEVVAEGSGAAKAPPGADAKGKPAKKASARPKAGGGETSIVNVAELQAREAARTKKRLGSEHPSLVAISTNLAGTQYPLVGDTLTIGRTSDNDIVIDHRSISRNHAKIVSEGGRYVLYDLESANGLKVNDEYYNQSVLRRGDVIELGHVRLRYVDAGETFVYSPEDTDPSLDSGEKKRSKAPLFVFVVLVLAAGGLGGFWWYSQNDNVVLGGQTAGNATVTPADGAAEDPKAPTEGPGSPTVAETPRDEAPREAVIEPQQATGDGAALAQAARDHLRAERWDEATAAYRELAQKFPDHPEAKGGVARVETEKHNQELLSKIDSAAKEGDFEAAWDYCQKASDVSEDSKYYNRLAELKKAVALNYVNDLVSKGTSELRSKDWSRAIAYADKALAIDPDHGGAKQLKAQARRGQQSADVEKDPVVKRDDKPKTPDKPKVEDKPKTEADSGKSAKDLYREGRAVHNSNPAQALQLYQQAANKGYAPAWKLIGQLKQVQGDTKGAITAYKKYISLMPSAPDAEQVRDAIIRLGGTP